MLTAVKTIRTFSKLNVLRYPKFADMLMSDLKPGCWAWLQRLSTRMCVSCAILMVLNYDNLMENNASVQRFVTHVIFESLVCEINSVSIMTMILRTSSFGLHRPIECDCLSNGMWVMGQLLFTGFVSTS